MSILLKDIGKRYQRRWVFKKLNFSFENGNRYALKGGNGSGKSTLLKILSGGLEPSTGEILWEGKTFNQCESNYFNNIGFCAPYIDLFDWMTLKEIVDFHFKCIEPLNNLDNSSIFELIGLQSHQHKRIASFSTGMRQRVKLALTILGGYKIIFLDEPTSNLDEQSNKWFHELLEAYLGARLLVIASNDASDLRDCNILLNIEDFARS